MKHLTFVQVQKMKSHITNFLSIANLIPEDEWLAIIKSIQEERKQLTKISNFAEMGNIFIVLFFVNELLEAILQKESSK
jgi:hypothetical protein